MKKKMKLSAAFLIFMCFGAIQANAGPSSINDACSLPQNNNSQSCLEQRALQNLTAFPIFLNHGGQVSCFDRYPFLQSSGSVDPNAKLVFSIHVTKDQSTGILAYTTVGTLNGIDASVLNAADWTSTALTIQLASASSSLANPITTLSVGAGIIGDSEGGYRTASATATRIGTTESQSLVCILGTLSQ